MSHFLFCFVETLAKLLTFTFNSGGVYIFIMEFMEKLHSLVSVILSILKNFMCLFVCLTDDTLFLNIQFFLFVFQLFLKRFNFQFVLCNLCALVLNCDTTFFQRGQYVFKRFILFIDLFACLFNDGFRDSEFGRNCKCITFSRNTDQQAISRTQCFYIKFAAGIFDTGSGKGKNFQFTVMSSCHGADSAFMQIRENRDGQCSTLRRVSSGAELVKQNQGMTVCFSKKRDDICHVGRKGT